MLGRHRPTDRPRFGTAGRHWLMAGRCTQAAKLEQLRLIATVAERQLSKLPLTHLVLGGTKRTLKYLFAVAQGTLLSPLGLRAPSRDL